MENVRNNNITAFYSIIIGVAVILMWVMILCGQDIPEGRTELSFHLASEFIMALICFTSGILMLRKYRLAKLLNTLGLGMVIYSVLNAAGYYGEMRNIPLMLFFSVLFATTVFVLLLSLRQK